MFNSNVISDYTFVYICLFKYVQLIDFDMNLKNKKIKKLTNNCEFLNTISSARE